jgi:hypothetical protein
MSEIIAAHFDGKVIVPDQPLQLPVGQKLRVRVEVAEPSGKAPTLAERLLKHAGTVPDLPADLAEQHDHYIHGTPKR